MLLPRLIGGVVDWRLGLCVGRVRVDVCSACSFLMASSSDRVDELLDIWGVVEDEVLASTVSWSLVLVVRWTDLDWDPCFQPGLLGLEMMIVVASSACACLLAGGCELCLGLPMRSNSSEVSVNDVGSGVVQVVLGSADGGNVLDVDTKDRVADIIAGMDERRDVRAIVLTGSGGTFSLGTDIAEMVAFSPTDHEVMRTGRVYSVLRDSSVPLIAAVEGYALGGACELALCCDLIVASEAARFGQPEILLGIAPGAGGISRLLHSVGRYHAMRLLLTGEPIDGRDAMACGLVSCLAPEGEALVAATSLATAIAQMPPLAVGVIKQVVRAEDDSRVGTALLLEQKAFQSLFASRDQKEGMTAFLEKRRAVFNGS